MHTPRYSKSSHFHTQLPNVFRVQFPSCLVIRNILGNISIVQTGMPSISAKLGIIFNHSCFNVLTVHIQLRRLRLFLYTTLRFAQSVPLAVALCCITYPLQVISSENTIRAMVQCLKPVGLLMEPTEPLSS
jgi:hypothetical protein